MEVIILAWSLSAASFLTAGASSSTQANIHRRNEASTDFDFFVLSLRSRGGFCLENPECVPIRVNWTILPLTIYGLWPTFANGSGGPRQCVADKPFDAETMKRSGISLSAAWPSLTYEGDMEFWRNQFIEYGSCALAKTKDSVDVNSYFEKAVHLYKNYYVLHGWSIIEPDNSNPIGRDELEKRIEALFPKRVQMVCRGQIRDFKVLQEVRLCFNKVLKPMDCSGEMSCDTGKIWFLEP